MRQSEKKKVIEAKNMITAASDMIRSVIDIENERYDNLTERAQDGLVGERIEETVDALESAADGLDDVVGELEEVLS